MLGRKKKSKKKKGKGPIKQKKKTDSAKLAEPKDCYDKFISEYFPDPVHSLFYSKSEWNDFMYDGNDLNDPNDIIELISDYAENEEYFDIYQICAFDAENDKKHYKSSISKALLCLILQLPSIIFIIYGEMSGSDKTWCNNLNEDGKDFGIIVSKCLAFGYSLYVSFYIEDYIQNKKRGMRCINLTDLSNKPAFLNGNWLRIGGYYNDFASYCATIASYMIIFLAESQIDLVLNALALFFLIEVDDLLVGQFDYHKIFNFIKDESIRNKIGFRIIDANHKQNGVRVVNSKIRSIQDGDIIDKINDMNISNKKEFDEYIDKYTQKKVTFHVNQPKDIGNVTVDIKYNGIKIGNNNDNKQREQSSKCTANDVWSFIYKFVDLPVRFVILIFKYIAPFYVGVCS